MDVKTYGAISGWIFTFFVGLSLLRIIFGWDMFIGEWSVPMWVDYVMLVLFGYLAYTGTQILGKKKKK